MRLSFDDDESFKGAVESLRFNNLPSDPNARHPIGSGSSVLLDSQVSEWNEDNNIPSDTITLGRVGSSSCILLETRGCLSPPSDPEFNSANGMCTIPGA